MLTSSPPRTPVAVAAAMLAVGMTAGCGGPTTDAGSGRLGVVTAFYPLEFVASRVGGDATTVTNLVKPGAEPHDLELTISQVGQISDARLIVYLKGFQSAVDEAVTQEGADRAFDVTTVQPLREGGADEHPHEAQSPAHNKPVDNSEQSSKDPHVWLDPTRLATIADQLAQRLGRIDPTHAADYTARAKALHAELDQLDQEYAQRLKTCQRREIVTSHTAFGYLAERYRLTQIGITGLSPEAEPTQQRMNEVAREAREHKATTIFFETLVSPKIAEAVAREVGAKTAVLDPLEGLPPGSTGDYLSVMRTNLTALATALGCS